MTPAEFMERLGSIDLGSLIKKANDTANEGARQAGEAAADKLDAVLKDIVQKFEAFGKEAGIYFEGRARLLSVCVAVVLAFAIRVDAIELFNTYLRDPNARNKVIEQSQAVTAQYKAAKEAAEALQKIASANPPPSDDVKAQVEALKKEWQSTVDTTRATVKQYADLGLPIGWTERMRHWIPGRGSVRRTGWRASSTQRKNATARKARSAAAVLSFGSLLLGGLLIGLGAPFWYDAVVGLTNIRSIAREVSGGGQNIPEPAGTAPDATGPATAAKNPDRPQPVTPVGAFTVSQAARV